MDTNCDHGHCVDDHGASPDRDSKVNPVKVSETRLPLTAGTGRIISSNPLGVGLLAPTRHLEVRGHVGQTRPDIGNFDKVFSCGSGRQIEETFSIFSTRSAG